MRLRYVPSSHIRYASPQGVLSHIKQCSKNKTPGTEGPFCKILFAVLVFVRRRNGLNYAYEHGHLNITQKTGHYQGDTKEKER